MLGIEVAAQVVGEAAAGTTVAGTDRSRGQSTTLARVSGVSRPGEGTNEVLRNVIVKQAVGRNGLV